MVAYARGLQFWVEKLNSPRSLDLCPLVGSIVELRETVQEHVTFNHWDVVQGLGVIHLGSTSRWPQTTLFSHMLSPPVEEEDFAEVTTHTTSAVAEEDVAGCPTPMLGTERQNQYLLVVGQLNLGPGSNNPKIPTADEDTFQNPWMAAIFPRVPGQSVMEAPL